MHDLQFYINATLIKVTKLPPFCVSKMTNPAHNGEVWNWLVKSDKDNSVGSLSIDETKLW